MDEARRLIAKLWEAHLAGPKVSKARDGPTWEALSDVEDLFSEHREQEFEIFRMLYDMAPDDDARFWCLFALSDNVEWWNDREFETWMMERAAGDDKLTYWLQYSSALDKWPFLWGKRQLPGDRFKR